MQNLSQVASWQGKGTGYVQEITWKFAGLCGWYKPEPFVSEGDLKEISE